MSDLTDAIEALRKVFDSQEGSYMYTKGYLDESDFELMLAAAGPIIRADERAKVSEDIAQRGQDTLHALLQEHLLANGKCYPNYCGDPDDHIWSEHIAETWRHRINKAITHPEDPSHGNNAHLPGEQPPDRPNRGPESHRDATTDQRRGTGTTATPKPAQTV